MICSEPYYKSLTSCHTIKRTSHRNVNKKHSFVATFLSFLLFISYSNADRLMIYWFRPNICIAFQCLSWMVLALYHWLPNKNDRYLIDSQWLIKTVPIHIIRALRVNLCTKWTQATHGRTLGGRQQWTRIHSQDSIDSRWQAYCWQFDFNIIGQSQTVVIRMYVCVLWPCGCTVAHMRPLCPP